MFSIILFLIKINVKIKTEIYTYIFSAMVTLCRELEIRHPEELSFIKVI